MERMALSPESGFCMIAQPECQGKGALDLPEADEERAAVAET
jgi:hypothetical protein